MSSLQKLKEKALQNEAVRREYDVLSEEYDLVDQLLKMRTAAGLTQDELAKRMGTKRSNISRLECGNTNPSWNMLKKYAQNCGFDISMQYHTR